MLSDVSFLYAYILGIIVQTIALLVSFNFNEPTITCEQAYDNSKTKKAFTNQVITSINVLKVRKYVFYIILFSALVGSLQTTVFFYSQQYFSNLGYTRTLIAVICGVGSLLEALSSKYAYRLEEWLRFKGILLTVSSMNIFALVGLSLFEEYSVFFYILTCITGGVAYAILSNYINMGIPSEYRATILSFDSFCFSVFMICIFPLFGFAAEYIGFTIAFAITAISYIPVMFFLIKKLVKYNKSELVNSL